MASQRQAAPRPQTPASSSGPKPMWKAVLSQKRGRLQYRASSNGITVRQYNDDFKKIADVDRTAPTLGWELKFPQPAFKNIICQQREFPTWYETALAKNPDAKRIISISSLSYGLTRPSASMNTDGATSRRYGTIMLTSSSLIDSIRFELCEAPTGNDCSQFPKFPSGASDDGDMDVVTQAAEFPLATLELKPGMEVRLAFEGEGRTNVSKGSYYWVWPMVVLLLVGKIYDAKDTEQNKARLDVCNVLALTIWNEQSLKPKDQSKDSEAAAQSPDRETMPSPSRSIDIPHRTLKRKAEDSFNLEWPEARDCNTEEELHAEEKRLYAGLAAIEERQTKNEERQQSRRQNKERIQEQLRKLQEELAAEEEEELRDQEESSAIKDNIQRWQRACLSWEAFRKGGPAYKKRA
ncbi:MAG: hypothetical protein Q9174_004022 [Haloplaca sp. 1 TL-2023]